MTETEAAPLSGYTGRPGCPCGGWGTHVCPVPAPEAMGVDLDALAAELTQIHEATQQINRAVTRARRPRRTLTPADVTRRYRSFSGGRLEAWEARSRDGAWAYRRIEISGTPWEIEHLPTGTEGGWYGTLTAARAATADGSALAYAERVQAHERGEHKAERGSQRSGGCCRYEPQEAARARSDGAGMPDR